MHGNGGNNAVFCGIQGVMKPPADLEEGEEGTVEHSFIA